MNISPKFQVGDYALFSLYCNEAAMAVAPIVFITAVRLSEDKVRYDVATEDGLTLKEVDSCCVYDRKPVEPNASAMPTNAPQSIRPNHAPFMAALEPLIH